MNRLLPFWLFAAVILVAAVMSLARGESCYCPPPAKKLRAEEVKRKKIKDLMAQFKQLYKEGKYEEAETTARKALELDPENATVTAAFLVAHNQAVLAPVSAPRTRRVESIRTTLGEAEEPLPDGIYTNHKTKREREIVRRLTRPITLNFADTPLRQVLEDIRSWEGLNMYIDKLSLDQEGISLDQPVTIKLENVSLKSALTLLLRSNRLTYLIKDEVLQITTESKVRGPLVTTTYLVADLVISPSDFGLLGTSAQPTSELMGSPAAPGGTPECSFPSATQERELIRLITSTVAPASWTEKGGAGTINYFPLTMSLFVNQTQDIHEQIQDLLGALRRLKDQEVVLAYTIVSVGEELVEPLKEKYGIDCKRVAATDDPSTRPQVTILKNRERKKFGEFLQNDDKTTSTQPPRFTLLSGQQHSWQMPGMTDWFLVDIDHYQGRFAADDSRPGMSLNSRAVIGPERQSVQVQIDLQKAAMWLPTWKVKETVTIPRDCTAVLSGWKMVGETPPTGLTRKVKSRTRYLLLLVSPEIAVREEEYQTGWVAPVPAPGKTDEEFLKETNQEVAAVLVKKYQQACREGRQEEAGKLAHRAIKLDPACFGKMR